MRAKILQTECYTHRTCNKQMPKRPCGQRQWRLRGQCMRRHRENAPSTTHRKEPTSNPGNTSEYQVWLKKTCSCTPEKKKTRIRNQIWCHSVCLHSQLYPIEMRVSRHIRGKEIFVWKKVPFSHSNIPRTKKTFTEKKTIMRWLTTSTWAACVHETVKCI